VESNDIFDIFDDEIHDEDVVATIRDDSGGQPGRNPFENDPAKAAPGETAKEEGKHPVREEESRGETGTDRKTEEERKPFTPSKAPVGRVLNDGPRKLNKQLILCAGAGTLVVFIIISVFITPLFRIKKTPAAKKPDTAALNPVDYSALVPKKVKEPPSLIEEQDDDDEILNTMPPVDPEYRYTPSEEKKAEPVTVTGSGNGSGRPDTKGDSLQGKTIPGIKGITPAQKQYAQGSAPYGGDAASPLETDNPYARFGMPSREDYTARLLSQYGQGRTPGYSAPSAYANQNDQSGKQLFHTAGRENAGNGMWLGPAALWQGTVFEAILTGSINTDLPGEATAVISKNVYSSLDGRYLLIPQNSKLFGTYNSGVSYSQSRVQVAWHTLIRPDGYYINLGNMQAADPRGAAGLPGLVNYHPFQYLKAIALLSVVNIVNSELNYSMAETNNRYVQNVMANTQETANTLGAKIIDRALDVQPTITIKEGTKINIIANNNLVLPPIQPYPVKYQYQRNR
jgi:type IV secretion system protein VirB10